MFDALRDSRQNSGRGDAQDFFRIHGSLGAAHQENGAAADERRNRGRKEKGGQRQMQRRRLPKLF